MTQDELGGAGTCLKAKNFQKNSNYVENKL